MRNLALLQNFGAGKTAVLAVLALTAGSMSLQADMVCLSDCGQTVSRLAAISGFEDVETDSSGFNIFFKPWLPVYSIPPSDLADMNSSSTNNSQDGLGDAGTLTFLKGAGSSDTSPDDGSSKSGGSSDPVSTLLNQITNPQTSGGTHDSPPVAMDPDPPTPTPEPRYSGFAMLGFGWVGLVAMRKFKALRAVRRES